MVCLYPLQKAIYTVGHFGRKVIFHTEIMHQVDNIDARNMLAVQEVGVRQGKTRSPTRANTRLAKVTLPGKGARVDQFGFGLFQLVHLTY